MNEESMIIAMMPGGGRGGGVRCHHDVDHHNKNNNKNIKQNKKTTTCGSGVLLEKPTPKPPPPPSAAAAAAAAAATTLSSTDGDSSLTTVESRSGKKKNKNNNINNNNNIQLNRHDNHNYLQQRQQRQQQQQQQQHGIKNNHLIAIAPRMEQFLGHNLTIDNTKSNDNVNNNSISSSNNNNNNNNLSEPQRNFQQGMKLQRSEHDIESLRHHRNQKSSTVDTTNPSGGTGGTLLHQLQYNVPSSTNNSGGGSGSGSSRINDNKRRNNNSSKSNGPIKKRKLHHKVPIADNITTTTTTTTTFTTSSSIGATNIIIINSNHHNHNHNHNKNKNMVQGDIDPTNIDRGNISRRPPVHATSTTTTTATATATATTNHSNANNERNSNDHDVKRTLLVNKLRQTLLRSDFNDRRDDKNNNKTTTTTTQVLPTTTTTTTTPISATNIINNNNNNNNNIYGNNNKNHNNKNHNNNNKTMVQGYIDLTNIDSGNISRPSPVHTSPTTNNHINANKERTNDDYVSKRTLFVNTFRPILLQAYYDRHDDDNNNNNNTTTTTFTTKVLMECVFRGTVDRVLRLVRDNMDDVDTVRVSLSFLDATTRLASSDDCERKRAGIHAIDAFVASDVRVWYDVLRYYATTAATATATAVSRDDLTSIVEQIWSTMYGITAQIANSKETFALFTRDKKKIFLFCVLLSFSLRGDDDERIVTADGPCLRKGCYNHMMKSLRNILHHGKDDRQWLRSQFEKYLERVWHRAFEKRREKGSSFLHSRRIVNTVLYSIRKRITTAGPVESHLLSDIGTYCIECMSYFHHQRNDVASSSSVISIQGHAFYIVRAVVKIQLAKKKKLNLIGVANILLNCIVHSQDVPEQLRMDASQFVEGLRSV
jgi:hypothetical protein